jgi:hypothetical protein
MYLDESVSIVGSVQVIVGQVRVRREEYWWWCKVDERVGRTEQKQCEWRM